MVRTLSLFVLVLALCGTAAAQGSDLSVGVGAYAVMFDWDAEGAEAFKYQGYTLTGTMALGPSSAIRGDLYFLKHEDHDEWKLEGFDAQFLLGSNLNRLGGKIYLLGGYWSESFEHESSTAKSDDDNDRSGLMAGLGLGYNWRSASLDVWAAWRDDGAYTDDSDKTTEEPSLTVGCGAVALTLRF